MGLLNALMGHASEANAEEISAELSPILGEQENVIAAYKLVRDLIVFTTGRIMLIDKQGMTGRKVNYHSVPYRAITQFTVETAGRFDMDSELKIWVSGQDAPIEIELSKNAAQGVQKTLANQIFK
ncbi:PH domain-containing protein [Alteromonas pelagimontana]|uniref:PH domain-containing protein n=1 Tax=Alteromonas pelagimontana TaxID=1858656 RepID=A0A6M4MF15_9ALTE|nr:PH domain-containing protein [Alteromonas pelagimontana]QJR81587.1 PH domain-containing protein [Alteromonas pelagimontana]